jgi:hypothetical protein
MLLVEALNTALNIAIELPDDGKIKNIIIFQEEIENPVNPIPIPVGKDVYMFSCTFNISALMGDSCGELCSLNPDTGEQYKKTLSLEDLIADNWSINVYKRVQNEMS